VPLGIVARPHGLRGEVRLRPYDGYSDLFLGDECPTRAYLRLDGADPVAVEIEGARIGPERSVLLALSNLHTRNDVEPFRGAELLADGDDLPPLGDDEWYATDLVGLAAVDPGGGALGAVRDVYSNGAHEILVVATPSGDVEVPFVGAHVGDVDLEAGRVVILDIGLLRA